MLVWRWLNNTALADPVARRLSPILQLMLLSILVAAPIAFSVDAATGGVAPDLAGAVLFLSLCLAAFVILRLGYFRATVWVVMILLLLGNNDRLTRAPVEAADEALLTFFLPVALAAVLSRRPVLLGMLAISCLIPLLPANAEKLGTPTISVFIVNLVLVSFLIDIVGHTLRNELKEAVVRNEALATAHQALEDSSAEIFKLHERLRVTLKSIGDAVIATDADARVTLLNNVAEELTGWTQAEAEGQHLNTVFRIINEQTRETVESPADKVLREGVTVGLANHTILLAKDGREVPIDDSGAPIVDSQGKITGVVLVFRDISERRASEEVLQQQIREIAILEERQRLSRDLHDATSQLLFSSGIIAESLTRVSQDPEKLQQNLERLRRLNRGASAEMRKLLMELRSPQLMHVRMPEMLQQLADAAMGNTNIEITLNVIEYEPLPEDIQIVFYRIAQEALNNVVKHAQASEASITFESEADSATLKVKDNGQGFESSESGPGIGLHTMRERADALGASMEIKSQPGEGTEVIIQWEQEESE